MKKDILSIFVDGNELKIVRAKRIKNKIKILSVESIQLKLPVEEKESVYADENVKEDFFGMEESEKDEADGVKDKHSENKNIFYNVLNKYSVENGAIAVNLPESNVGFISFDTLDEKSKRKLKKRVIEEIQKDYDLTVTGEKFFLLPGSNGLCTAVFQHGNNPVLDILEDIQPFLKNKLSIELVEVNEIALVNFINRVYSFKEDELSVVIYIGNDFSRILFIRDGKIERLIPIINEGYTSENILTRLYGKIMLERDESSHLEFTRIILAGESILIEGKEFFEEKFPNAEVFYAGYEGLDISALDESDIEHLSSFAIPVSTAWKMLEPKNDVFTRENFLPKEVKNRQKSLKIAWYELVILIAMCITFIYFLGQYILMERKIGRAEHITALLDEQISSANEILVKMDNIQNQISQYEQRFALYNSLIKNSVVTSGFLEDLSHNVMHTGSLWLNSLNIENGNFSMGGESLFKNRISGFVSLYEDYTLNSVNGLSIRNRDVYEFNLKGRILSFSEEEMKK